MREGERMRPETKAIALGRPRDPGDGVNAPVSFSSTYRAGGDRTYARDVNPTWEAFEEVIGALEGGLALSFASGLAAVSAVVETLPAGTVVVAPGDAYNGTRRLLSDLASRGRIELRLIDQCDLDGVAASLDGAGLLWLESPTNPLMAIADLTALAELGHTRGALVAADNTFATPMLQHPLELGVDVVVHSATKLIAGHSDVVMGATVTNSDELQVALARRRSLHGAIPGPMEVFLALRGLRTLPIRVERASASAGELAARLASHASVDIVRFPGLSSHPQRALVERQMSGPGAMVSFEVKGTAAQAEAVCAAVRLIVHATSLGGVETSIERRGRWEGEGHLPQSLLRLSVGLEAVDDIWDDLDQALLAAAG